MLSLFLLFLQKGIIECELCTLVMKEVVNLLDGNNTEVRLASQTLVVYFSQWKIVGGSGWVGLLVQVLHM